MMRGPYGRIARTVLGLALGLLLGLPAVVGLAQQQPSSAPRGADVIVVLDVSASVIGRDDAHSQNIWDELTKSLESLIDQVPQGTRFAILPFAQGPMPGVSYPGRTGWVPGETLPLATIETARDRDLAKQWLRRQNPNGDRTFIVETLDYALGQLKLWAQQPNSADRRQALYLYTDGLDNKSGKEDPNGWQTQASQLVNDLQNNGYPFLWTAFVRIGDNPAPCPQGFNVCPRPGTSIHLSPDSLDFGVLTDIKPSAVRQISMDIQNVDPSADIPLDLQLINGPPGISIKQQSIHGAPTVDVELDARAGLAPGDHTATLQVRGPTDDVNFAITNSIDVQFSYQVSPPATPTVRATVAPVATLAATVASVPTAAAAATAAPSPTPTIPPSPPPPPPDLGPVAAVLGVLGFFALGALDNIRKQYTP